MTRNRHNLLRAVLLAAYVAAGAALCTRADATVYRDCFEIIDYVVVKHVACTVDGLTDIHYSVEKYERYDWEVIWHGGGNDSRIVKAQSGEHILTDNVFTNRSPSVTGTAYPFVFEFYHWYKNETSGKTWYGYVSLGLDENDELVILESAITDAQGALTVTGAPETVLPPSLRTIDHGDWLELDKQCVKPSIEGMITIPSAVDGKPIRAIGRYAFNNCEQITRITLPDTIEVIGECAFNNCSALTALYIPNSVTNIGEQITSGCKSLGDLRIGSGISSIPRISFVGTGMTNLVISVGTTNIEEYAFASNAKLKSVTMPQSMERIHSLAFYRCSALTAVSVPYATVIEDEAFPPGCTITRYGPYPSVAGDLTPPDEETKIAMFRTLDWRDYASRLGVMFCEMMPPYAESPDSRSAVYACAHLGIAPAAKDDEGSDLTIVAYYKMPSVEFLGIDPATRTITGRVIPAEGTRIVSAPLDRAFGFHRIYRDYDGAMLDGLDWGREMYYGYPGFELDTSCYVESNGLFRITFPEDVLWEKEPQPAHLFRIKLSDKAGCLW